MGLAGGNEGGEKGLAAGCEAAAGDGVATGTDDTAGRDKQSRLTASCDVIQCRDRGSILQWVPQRERVPLVPE